MLDIAVAYNKYKFSGYEFLTWLWFKTETDFGYIKDKTEILEDIYIDDKITIENFNENSREKITIKGDQANLEEGIISLSKGAFVTELKISLRTSEEKEFKFTLKGESLDIASFNIKKYKFSDSPDEIEGSLIEKIYYIEQLTTIVDKLFQAYINVRISDSFESYEIVQIKRWIKERSGNN